MQGLAVWLPRGDAGVRATVQWMRQVARLGGITPLVRHVTARLVLGAPASLYPRLIRDWIGEHTTFLADPTHAEALHDPGWMVDQILTAGLVQVDCDDVAMLAAAMGLSIGLRARFVIVGFGSPSAPYRHVWTELADASGVRWLPVDPTRPQQSFGSLPISRRFDVEV
jgi:hypothetical protein